MYEGRVRERIFLGRRCAPQALQSITAEFAEVGAENAEKKALLLCDLRAYSANSAVILKCACGALSAGRTGE